MPGKHASPFLWWMTADAWKAWGVIAIVYLAAFLAGTAAGALVRHAALALGGGGVLAVLLMFCLGPGRCWAWRRFCWWPPAWSA